MHFPRKVKNFIAKISIKKYNGYYLNSTYSEDHALL